MGETKIRRGRPPKLDPHTSARLAALLIAGATTVEAVRELGVDRRTLTRWRARAWIRESDDQPYVELEQLIMRGKIAAAEVGQPRVACQSHVVLQPLDDLLADLDDKRHDLS